MRWSFHHPADIDSKNLQDIRSLIRLLSTSDSIVLPGFGSPESWDLDNLPRAFFYFIQFIMHDAPHENSDQLSRQASISNVLVSAAPTMAQPCPILEERIYRWSRNRILQIYPFIWLGATMLKMVFDLQPGSQAAGRWYRNISWANCLSNVAANLIFLRPPKTCHFGCADWRTAFGLWLGGFSFLRI